MYLQTCALAESKNMHVKDLKFSFFPYLTLNIYCVQPQHTDKVEGIYLIPFCTFKNHIHVVLYTSLPSTYMIPLLCSCNCKKCISQFLFCKFMAPLQARKYNWTHYSIRNLCTPLEKGKGNNSGSSMLQSVFFPFLAFFEVTFKFR